jgi:hypothetical protein
VSISTCIELQADLWPIRPERVKPVIARNIQNRMPDPETPESLTIET